MIDHDRTILGAFMVPKAEVKPDWRSCLVILSGDNIGKIIVLESDTITIGRVKDAGICLTQGMVSRTHALIQRSGDHEFVIVDQNSTNGTFVNSQKVQRHVLVDQDIIGIGGSTLKFISSDNPEHAYYEEIYRQSHLDKALKIYNKHYFLHTLGEKLARSQQDGSELSLIMFDVDHFKRLNDTYGHLAGDAVLVQLADIGKSCIRENDLLCRYGGEEFGLILPHTTLQQAYQLAERLRSRIVETTIHHAGAELKVTISLGVSSYVPQAGKLMQKDELIAQADQALYQAKHSGRNRTQLFVSDDSQTVPILPGA